MAPETTGPSTRNPTTSAAGDDEARDHDQSAVIRWRTNPRVSRRPYAELTARMSAFIAPESVQRASTKPTTSAVTLPPPLSVMRVSELPARA